MDGDIAPLSRSATRRALRPIPMRRGPCGRHVWSARRRHRRARWRHAPHRRPRRYAGQGVRCLAAISPPAPTSSRGAPTPRASSSPPRCRRRSAPGDRAIRHLKTELGARAHRTAPPRQGDPDRGGLPVMSSDTHIVPLFVGDPENCKRPAISFWKSTDLYPADQLPDRGQGHRAAAHHAVALSRRRADRPACGSAAAGLGAPRLRIAGKSLAPNRSSSIFRPGDARRSRLRIASADAAAEWHAWTYWKGIVGGWDGAIVWLSRRGNTLPGILRCFDFAVIAL